MNSVNAKLNYGGKYIRKYVAKKGALPIPKEHIEDAVLFYAGEFGYFMSNFSAFELNYDDQIWKTSEHAYQASKFPKDSPAYKEILSATSAHNALKIARRNSENKRSEWNELGKIWMKLREEMQAE